MSSNKFAERILKAVKAKGYKPQTERDLSDAMGIAVGEMDAFDAACQALLRQGRIVLGARAVLLPAPAPGRVIGTYRANPRGFGFVIPTGPSAHDDVYVPASATGGAVTGDTVVVRVAKRGKRGGKMLYDGRVVEILQRGRKRFVGELRGTRGHWFVIADGNTLSAPIVVSDAEAKDARPGDQVVVEILRYPTPTTDAAGVIVKVLGERGRPDVDTQSVIEQYELPGEFPDDVWAETRSVIDAYDPELMAKDRDNLFKKTIITIDPVDARDFDDAISLERREDGLVELGVHIADVAHFVREGGALDTEARARANSVYLPGIVIPMLPELLSNGVCSLQEREPRLTKSAFITFNDRGEVRGARFANTVIRSAKRLTYEQASRVLDGKPGRMSAKVVALLHDMETLAHAIRARRLREGMLELELPDAELVFNEDGRVVDVVPEDTSFSHKIIEMFMVEANEAVARKLTTLNVPFLRRIHDEPADLSDGTLRRFLSVIGHALSDKADRFALQALLDEVRGKPESFPVHLAVLRSMNQAEYSPKFIGHYALASANYCHFTSPIRRYPDLTVHRLLDAAMCGDREHHARLRDAVSEFDLSELGNHCGTNERRAEAAERELRLVFILQLLEGKVGETFDAVVTGIVSAGVFVQLERYLVDAFLPFDRLPDDRWVVDPTRAAASGERTRLRVTVGDRLKVGIASIQVPTRRLEVALVEPLATSTKRRGDADPVRRPPEGRSKRPRSKQTYRNRGASRGRGKRGR